jgi:hypothetical protein
MAGGTCCYSKVWVKSMCFSFIWFFYLQYFKNEGLGMISWCDALNCVAEYNTTWCFFPLTVAVLNVLFASINLLLLQTLDFFLDHWVFCQFTCCLSLLTTVTIVNVWQYTYCRITKNIFVSISLLCFMTCVFIYWWCSVVCPSVMGNGKGK